MLSISMLEALRPCRLGVVNISPSSSSLLLAKLLFSKLLLSKLLLSKLLLSKLLLSKLVPIFQLLPKLFPYL